MFCSLSVGVEKRLSLVSLIIMTLVTNPVSAEVVRYKDSSGRMHYVEGKDKVPQQYRAQVKNAKPLPKITYMESTRMLAQPESRETFAQQKKVEVYMTTWCPACKQLEQYLKQQKIRYRRYDIDSDTSALQRYKKFRSGGVPVVKIGETVLVGFNPGQIQQALAN